jgi:cleavage stimulation factor subunit 2
MFSGLPIGNRTLRADFSNENSVNTAGSRNTTAGGYDNPNAGLPPVPPQSSHYNVNGNGYNQYGGYPQMNQPPQHVNNNNGQLLPTFNTPTTTAHANNLPPSNLIANDSISRTLSQFPPTQLLEIMSSMKSIISQKPDQASEFLHSNSQVTYALVQALLLMGLIDVNVLAQAVQNQTQVQSSPSSLMPQTSTPPIQSARLMPQPQIAHPAAPPLPPPPPPPPASSFAPSQPQQPYAPIQNVDPQQAALIKQVLELTDEQINFLPPDQKNTILTLRENYRRGIFT